MKIIILSIIFLGLGVYFLGVIVEGILGYQRKKVKEVLEMSGEK